MALRSHRLPRCFAPWQNDFWIIPVLQPHPSVRHTTSLSLLIFVRHAVAELADSGKCAARSSHSPQQLVVGRSSSGQFVLQHWSVALQASSSCCREVVFRSRQRLSSELDTSMVSVGRPNGLWLVIWQRHRRREFEMPPLSGQEFGRSPFPTFDSTSFRETCENSNLGRFQLVPSIGIGKNPNQLVLVWAPGPKWHSKLNYFQHQKTN